jgi:hypothetical protein
MFVNRILNFGNHSPESLEIHAWKANAGSNQPETGLFI